MWIESRDGDPRVRDSAAMKKVLKQQTDSDDLVFAQGGSDFTQGQMRRHERHGQLSTREQHREILDTATIGEEFGLARKLEASLVHPRLMNRSRHDSLNFAAERQSNGLFNGVEGRAGGFPGWLAGRAGNRLSDNRIFRGFGQTLGSKRRSHDFWTDAGGIAESNADATPHRALSSTRR
jgi:hypothetical protein